MAHAPSRPPPPNCKCCVCANFGACVALRAFACVAVPARGMSLRKVSYEAFVFSVFSRNWGKKKPTTWRSVSSLLPSQAAPNLLDSITVLQPIMHRKRK